MTQTTEDAVRVTIEVAVGVERAFEVFTKDFDRIKPASTTCSADR